MRIVIFSCTFPSCSIENDPRVRKSGIWLQMLGHDVVYVEGWHPDVAPDVMLRDSGQDIDGIRLYHANGRTTGHIVGGIMSLKPDAIHAHEVGSL